MEISQLSELLETVPCEGISLSQVERLKIGCSLLLLKNQMKCEGMFFLGKILAIQEDYYVAFSTDMNKYLPSIFYCSQDAVTWFSLTGSDKDIREEAILLRTPFTGNLISEFTLPSGRIINEELRLACVVSDLFENCFLIPRGFVLQTALDYVLPNPMWKGIPLDQCRKLSNLRHWRTRHNEMTLLDKALSNPAFDFLEPLDDVSEFSFVFSGPNDEVKMKSLKWPGFIFSLRQKRFANAYFGYGIAETNVSEILPIANNVETAHKNIA